jgi:hypothetical protein
MSSLNNGSPSTRIVVKRDLCSDFAHLESFANITRKIASFSRREFDSVFIEDLASVPIQPRLENCDGFIDSV